MLALAVIRFLFCLKHVRTAFDERGRQAWRHDWQRDIFQCASSRNGPRILTKENRQHIFLDGDLLFELRNRDQGLLILRFDLRHLDLRNNACLEAQLEDTQGTGIVTRRGTRDFELTIQRAQRDVTRGDAGDHSQQRTAPSLFAGENLRLGRLTLPTHPAKEVDLPIGAG